MKTAQNAKNSHRSKLSRQKIFSTALNLAQKRGIESLSMRTIAKSLNVEAMSLYKHIENKNDLLDGVIELLINQITLPDLQKDWKLALKERAISEYKVLSDNSWVLHTLESRSGTGSTRLIHQNHMLGILRVSGFSTALAFHTMVSITGYVYGFVVFHRAWSKSPREKSKSESRVAQDLSIEKHPYVAEAISFAMNRKKNVLQNKNEDFEFGLDLLIEGIDKLLIDQNK